MITNKLQKHISSNFAFLNDKKSLIAISGGVDSVVLTHIFNNLGFKISLAHCNFQLRGKDSQSDEDFVKTLADKLGVQVFVTKFNTREFAEQNKLSIQVAARELRYNWFGKILGKHDFDYLLTAHHLDDSLETFFINLLRGTGLEGLTGIPPINGKTVRPLLHFSKEDILNYAKENDLQWREDQSNNRLKYIRNKIRHRVIPVLKDINPSLLDSFQKTVENLRASQQIVDDHIAEVSPKIMELQEDGLIKFKIKELRSLKNPKAYLYAFLKGFGFTQWDDVHRLIYAQSGKQIFSKTHRLVKNRDFLLLCKIEKYSTEQIFLIGENQRSITNPIALKISEASKKPIQNKTDKKIIFLDKELINFPLVLRKWQKGDYFYPSKMKGRKKLSHYFRDEKYSILEKENIWLLCSDRNQIIWVVGKRQDDRFLVKNQTKKVLKVEFDTEGFVLK